MDMVSLQLIINLERVVLLPGNGSLNFQRILNTELPVGFEKVVEPTITITTITNADAKVITTFPGTCK
jgi:hypothetical protein